MLHAIRFGFFWLVSVLCNEEYDTGDVDTFVTSYLSSVNAQIWFRMTAIFWLSWNKRCGALLSRMSWQSMMSTVWDDFSAYFLISWCLPVRCWIILLWVISPLKFNFNSHAWSAHSFYMATNILMVYLITVFINFMFFFWLCVPILSNKFRIDCSDIACVSVLFAICRRKVIHIQQKQFFCMFQLFFHVTLMSV